MYTKKELSNGIKLHLFQKETNTVSVQFAFNVGSYVEAEDEKGITHLIEHLVFNASDNFESGEYAKVMTNKGAYINAYTSGPITNFHYDGIKETFLETLENQVKLITNFNPSVELLSKELKVVLNEIDSQKDNDWSMCSNYLKSICTPNHNSAIPVIGYKEHLENVSTEHLKEYFTKNFNANNLNVVISGDIVEFEKEIETLLLKIPSKNKTDINYTYITEPNKTFVEKKKEGLQQTKILSELIVPINRPLLNIVSTLIGGSMDSFLWKEFREKRSLCYLIQCQSYVLDPKTSCLQFKTALSDNNDKELALSLFKESIEWVKTVEEEEFNQTKFTIKAEYLKEFDSVANLSDYIVSQTKDLDPKDANPYNFIENLDKVTYENFKDFTKTLDQSKLYTIFYEPLQL